MKTGRYNIAQLLTSPEVEQIIIPELQRDYVWGERNVKGLLASILDNYNKREEQTLQISDFRGNEIEQDIRNFLNEEYMRLRYNTRVGFIYAYHDRSLSSQYYLIDGQQRITTIFLILLALYRRVDQDRFRKMYFVACVPKIDYKVREVAHDFLVDFIEYELTKEDSSKTFKESSKYYSEYNKDITAQSIFANYYNVIVPALAAYDNVESLIDYIENYIEFNYFDTNISEQGEKLYLYMNSRGESLSVQERIKSIIVGRSSEKLKAGKIWEDWQNFFWRIKPQSDNNADRGFYEFLKWATVLHMCKYHDSKIKKTYNIEKSKSRIEEIEDYIRIEKDDSAKVRQADWIFTYISENESFSFEWLHQIETAVETMYVLLQESEYKKLDLNQIPWFHGCDETIEYVTLLGLLYYITVFKISTNDKINALRVLMYLKNLQSEYTLRRNPDRAVIRSFNLIDWMSKNSIKDVRLAGIHAQRAKEIVPDRYVLRIDDLRWGYYLLDWQYSQHSSPRPDQIGRWESFFWEITNNKNLNRFLRGNHDFIVKIMRHGILTPEEFLKLFIGKIYDCRNSDSLRKNLLKYGDISVSDGGGSSNIGPNWMERWCLLGSNSDETYWDSFMNGENSAENASIVASYLLNNQSNMIVDPITEVLRENLGYMKQKYYLWSDNNQRIRFILLEQKQASKTKARELCIQYLHRQITDSWVWDHNYCVSNFVPTPQGLITDVQDKNTGYYIDLWYDWFPDGGKWYCRIGHKEHDLSDDVITSIQAKSHDMQKINCNWSIEDSIRKALIPAGPIYVETRAEDYFAGSRFVKKFFDEILVLLNHLNVNGVL